MDNKHEQLPPTVNPVPDPVNIHRVFEQSMRLEQQNKAIIENLGSLATAFDRNNLSKRLENEFKTSEKFVAEIASIGKLLTREYSAIASEAMKITAAVQRSYSGELAQAIRAAQVDLKTAVFLQPEIWRGLNTSIAEMQRFTAASFIELNKIDWAAISATQLYKTDYLSAAKSSIADFASSYDNLFRSLRLDTLKISPFPELPQLAVDDFYRTVRVVEVIQPAELSVDTSDFTDILPDRDPESDGTIRQLIHALNPDLLNAWDGAIAALENLHTDHERHWSTSIRELITHVLHTCAPDDALRRWSTDPNDLFNGKWTRKARLRYICRRLIPTPEYAAFIDSDIKSFLALMDLLQGGTHGMPSKLTSTDIPLLHAKVESMLIFVLRIANESTG